MIVRNAAAKAFRHTKREKDGALSSILVVGQGPLLQEGTRRFTGQSLRTWYFTRPLVEDGHAVHLVTLPLYDPDDPDRFTASLVTRECEGFEYQAFTNCDFDFIDKTILRMARSLRPDAVVGVNTVPAWVGARLPLPVPLWADLNGYEMAEKQGQAARTGDDSVLVAAWRMESCIARRADKFSTVSRPQLHALLGEMAGLGRLNRHTFHYHFGHHIPNAVHPMFASAPAPWEAAAAPAVPALRGPVVPEDAFVVLWSGGYNFWTSAEFLFECIERAMALCPRLHYVSTGGAIALYDETTYAAFEALVAESPHRDRYHLLGWVPSGDLPGIYREADVGLNVDEPNYETLFGARNRINNLMAAGLAVVTTAGTEISRTVEEAGCGVVCSPGEADELARALVRLAESPAERLRLAKRGRAWALREWAPEKLVEPLRQWVREPALAPDNAIKLREMPDLQSLRDATTNRLEESAAVAEEYDLPALVHHHADLVAIRSKVWYRTLKGFKDRVLRLVGRK